MAKPANTLEEYESVSRWLRSLSYRYARQLRLDPEEVGQEVALEFFSCYPHYNPKLSAITTWTSLIAKRAALRLNAYHRKHSQRAVRFASVTEETDGDIAVPEPVGREPDPHSAAEVADLIEVARRHVERLKPIQREAVLVRFGLAEGSTNSDGFCRGIQQLQRAIRMQG